MSGINIETIRTNPNAPSGFNAVNMYSVNDSELLTLAQLVAAVCFFRAATLEARSVIQMNQLQSNTGLLDTMSNVVHQMIEENASYETPTRFAEGYRPKKVSTTATVYEFLTQECGIDSAALPGALSSSTNRLAAYDTLRRKMDAVNTLSQQRTIDLQSTVNWRDVTFNMSSGIIGRNGTTGMNMANNI
ncbi:MAG: hypothetical protein IJJ26_12170 [Victivallales bacterium]|nr:hypothetical protein [Victivallales bacterium]